MKEREKRIFEDVIIKNETGHLFDHPPAQYWPLATLITTMASLAFFRN